MWDDEENLVRPNQRNRLMTEQSEDEEAEEELEDEVEELVEGQPSAKSRSATHSQMSSLSAKEQKALEMRLKAQERKKRMLRRFLDEEAELGSDDEEKDDIRKQINKNDDEENEDGLDADLEGFVVHEGDEAEVGDANEDLQAKFQADMDELDRMEIQKTMQAVIFGRNLKRKRGEVDYLDQDDNSKRKMRLIEERMKQIRDGIENGGDFLEDEIELVKKV